MRLMALGLLIVVSCTACSDNDIQIGFEKVDSQEKSTVHADHKKAIYIEFANSKNVKSAENDKVPLPLKEQMNEQEAVEAMQLEIVEAETVKNIQEKTFGELLEERIDLSLQETAEVYQEATPIEAINERMIELLEQRDEQALEESLRKAINVTSKIDSLTEDDLIKQLEISLAEIDDADIMANYGSEGSAIDLYDGALALKNHSIPLAISPDNLVSVVASIPGSTSIKANPDGFGLTVDLSGDYLFEFDQDILSVKAKEALQSIIVLYKKYDGIGIDVAAHTDSKGSSNYNLALSQRRANAVKQWFESEGISSAVITAEGHGESQPVSQNTKKSEDDFDGRKLNRRVNIAVKTRNEIDRLP